MRLFGFDVTRARAREERAVTITQNASYEEILAFFGLDPTKLPPVNTRSALRVPAVLAAVTFLSRTMATLDLAAWRKTKDGPVKIGGRLGTLIESAPNPSWSGFEARRYFWQNVFLHGRGLFAILRMNGQPYELWPINVAATRVSMNVFGEKSYTITVSGSPLQTVTKTFQAEDVIDVPFMLAEDMCNVLSPVQLGEKAIQLALAMNEYGATFFAGGGVPPLALSGPLPQGKEAMQRAMNDIHRAIDAARSSDKPVFPMPPGHELKQVGYDPAKGQMTDARRMQIEEIGRVWQLPPVFLGDLTHGTLNNSEMQDTHLVKHNISQWCKALEDEANLKLFGQLNGNRYIRHDVDSIQRGDFLTRQDGLAKSVQGGIRTPNEARRSEGLPDHGNKHANDLFMQGATVPLGVAPNPDPNHGDGAQ